MADVPGPGFRKYWRQKLSSLKSQCHAITNKYPEAVSVVQQVCKLLSDIETLAKYTPAKVVKSSQWITIVNSAEENRGNFCKILEGKPLFSALYGTYTLTARTAGRPEGECAGRTRWSSNQNLTGISGPR
jgi:hypothetical protein